MSGRVMWERFSWGGADRCLVVDGVRHGSACLSLAFSLAWRAQPYGTDDDRFFRRRSDAKRWLLARAAGLAEVPRGASFGTRYGSPQTNAVVPCGPEGMSVPRGWRVVDAYVAVDGQVVVMLERNRRRR